MIQTDGYDWFQTWVTPQAWSKMESGSCGGTGLPLFPQKSKFADKGGKKGKKKKKKKGSMIHKERNDNWILSK